MYIRSTFVENFFPITDASVHFFNLANKYHIIYSLKIFELLSLTSSPLDVVTLTPAEVGSTVAGVTLANTSTPSVGEQSTANDRVRGGGGGV